MLRVLLHKHNIFRISDKIALIKFYAIYPEVFNDSYSLQVITLTELNSPHKRAGRWIIN